MYPFSLSELMIYIMPILMVYLIQKYFKDYLKFFKEWPLTMAIILIPLWLTSIYLLGWLIFDYNLVPFILFFSCFILGLQLYDYVRSIDHFTFKNYYLMASKLLFQHLSAFFLGLVILRLFTYFVG
ncbi:hypothetical protein [Globicatella sanguinis]